VSVGVKVALVIEAAGAPNTLASTAFAGALLDGLRESGYDAIAIGLAQDEALWIPESLGGYRATAPWLSPPEPSLADRLAAAKLGVFDDRGCSRAALRFDVSNWYLELLFERQLRAFAGDTSHGVLMIYPRSHVMFEIGARVAARLGWRLLALGTEALSDKQIDPATRSDYINSVVCCADGLWTVSEYLASFWIAQGMPPERVMTWPPLVRSTSFREAGPAPRAHAAVYVGNLMHREIDYLLDIAHEVRSKLEGFSLRIYGDAPRARREELTALLGTRGLGDVVRIEHPVTPVEVPAVLASADVLLLPRSSGEFSTAGFPNKLGEYLASGRPVVVTGVGDIPHYLRDGETALIVDPDDCSAFADAVLRVLSDQDLADRIGAAGERFAAHKVRADRVASRVISFVEELPRNPSCWPIRTSPIRRAVRLCETMAEVEAIMRLVVRLLRTLRLKPPGP